MDFQAFYEGRAFDAYEYLGAHPQLDGGVVVRVYAPNAHGVSLIGEFNGWHEAPMNRTENAGFFELRISEALTGQMYKYVIYGQNGRRFLSLFRRSRAMTSTRLTRARAAGILK